MIAAVGLLAALGAGLAVWQPWVAPLAPASVSEMAYPLPDEPSIAVLPFDNFSGADEDAFIAKGLTEDLITALSRLPQLFVISRVSSFAYGDKQLTVTEIAEELGVRYILEGSIQRSGETLRINAQLIDAITGHHLWADNFDGAATDLFALQDDVVRRTLVELQGTLSTGDHARIAGRGTRNLDAWLLRQQAVAELYKFTRESTIRTRELLQAAHELDPAWARPIGGLAWSYWWEARMGWAEDRAAWIDTGVEYAEAAIRTDPDDPIGYMQLGNLRQLSGDHEGAIRLREKAVSIAPNDFQANWGLGSVLYKAGETERAVEVLEHARRVSPRHPVSFTWTLAYAQLYDGRYADVVETATEIQARAPDRDHGYVLLAASLAALDRQEEAARAADGLLRIDPDFTVSRWLAEPTDFRDRAVLEKVGRLLVEAGLPA